MARATELVVAALSEAIAASGYARFAIAGGSATAPLGLIRRALGSEWKCVKLTWVDERCVDFDHADSNRGAASRQGGLSSDDPPGFELPLWIDSETPSSACARVTTALREEFGGGLDVALLGMGADGHIASLFPGHEAFKTAQATPVLYVEDSPKPPSRRMTLSLPFLRDCSHKFLFAKGESKRTALGRARDGETSTPAGALGTMTILTDIELGIWC